MALEAASLESDEQRNEQDDDLTPPWKKASDYRGQHQ